MSDRQNPFDLISQEIGLPSGGFGRAQQHPFSGFGVSRVGAMSMDLIPDLPPMPMQSIPGGIHQIMAPTKKGKAASARNGDYDKIEKRRKREREAAARSRQRKANLIGHLESKVQAMASEIAALKMQVVTLGGVPASSAGYSDKIKKLDMDLDEDEEQSSVNSTPNPSPKRGTRSSK